MRSDTATAPAHGALILVVVFLTGCQTARVDRPLSQQLGGNDPNEQLEFWHQLADQSVTSNDDAFHGLLLFLDGQDPAADYAGRVQTLKSRRMLPQKFDQPAERAVDRGTLAVAIVRALDIKGGLTMRIIGPTPRYAVRELVFMELYPPSSPGQTFSGVEYLGIIGKLEDHQRAQAADRRGPDRDAGLPVGPEPRPGVQPTPPGETETGARSG